jgi:hypothetical protein
MRAHTFPQHPPTSPSLAGTYWRIFADGPTGVLPERQVAKLRHNAAPLRLAISQPGCKFVVNQDPQQYAWGIILRPQFSHNVPHVQQRLHGVGHHLQSTNHHRRAIPPPEPVPKLNKIILQSAPGNTTGTGTGINHLDTNLASHTPACNTNTSIIPDTVLITL